MIQCSDVSIAFQGALLPYVAKKLDMIDQDCLLQKPGGEERIRK